MVIKSVGVLSAGKIYRRDFSRGGFTDRPLRCVILDGGRRARPAGEGAQGFLAPLFGVGAVIALPILYGCMGFVVGAVSALFYNAFAGMVGGVEVQTE